MLRSLAPIVLAFLACAATAQPSARHRAVPAGEEVIRIDGRLDEAVWSRVPVFDAFQQQDPYTGGPAPIRTTTAIAFDRHALYFAVRAYDPAPANIRAPRVRYDKVFRDQDFIVVYVDGVGTGAAAQWFRVNAGGGVADGVHTAATDHEDFSPDFEWDAAARIDADGYTVEIRIPFATLRFAHDNPAPWRVQIARRMPREQTYLFVSTPLTRESPSFIAEMRSLEDFRGPATEFLWVARPTFTLRRLTEKPDDPATQRNDFDAGLDLKVRPRADWVIDATLNPDFSQIELDVPQLARNRQFALLLQEKRPFFLEGSDLAQTGTDALYSRSITDPRWGARATYRGEALAGTLLSVADRGGGLVLLPSPYLTGFADQPAGQASTARLRWDRGALSLGAVASDRNYKNAGYNRLAGPDALWHITEAQFVRAQALLSSTSAFADAGGTLSEGAARDGHFINVEWYRNSAVSAANLKYREVSDAFRNDNGFLGQNGFRRLAGSINRQFRPPGVFFNEITPYVDVAYAQAYQGGHTIGGELRPGLYTNGPRSLELNVQWRPRERAQVDAAGPLHEYRQWWVNFTMGPGRVLTLVTAEITAGERVDIFANRVRPGWTLVLSGRLRITDFFEVEPSFNQGVLEAEDGGRAQSETAAQWLSVLHFSARDSLRLIVQRLSFQVRNDAFYTGAPIADRSTTGSLVFSHRRSAATVFYLGATRSRGRTLSTRSNTSEVFGKVQVGF
ncbi:MAG TPA: DUF5916 domain-containing protein [Burkholderiaceae bacterium]|nr:DUF5916 domain-containing protein [Burkholderiaceae bacterium]